MTNPNTSRTARATITNPSGLLQLKFLRITTDVMKQERIACKSDIISMKQELALLEDARLHIRKKDDKRYFTCIPKDKTNEIAITQDPDRVLELARREYLEKEIKISEKRLKWLDRIADSAECAKEEQRLLARLQRFDDAHLDLCRILFTREQNEWIDAPYTPNPYYQEFLKEPTDGGLLTRSKSEANIGSWAESVGLPYRYDDIVRIKQGNCPDPPNRWSYFADFKFPNFCAGITINEHFGSFHKRGYADNGLERLNDYHNHTVIELPDQPVRYNEFTWSFESDLRNPDHFRDLIRRILLPYPV